MRFRLRLLLLLLLLHFSVWLFVDVQVLINVCMIVLDEEAPGAYGWLTWRDVLHLADMLCCCAILFPIFWSIKSLKQAAEADGKGPNPRP